MIAARRDRTGGAWLSGTLLRLALCAVVLVPIAVVLGEALISKCLPAVGAIFAFVADDFRLLSLTVDHEGADRVVRATVAWKDVVVFGGTAIHPDPRGRANASTLLAHALQGPLTALLAAAAWPSARGRMPRREMYRRCVLLVPAIGVLVAIDIPFVLAGELQALAVSTLAPGTPAPLAIWARFLGGGGRYALGLVAAVLVVQAARCPSRTATRTSGRMHGAKPRMP